MKGRAHDPQHLDVTAAAAEGAQLSGRWPLASLPRLVDDAAGGGGDAEVDWAARFESRRARVGPPEIWLHLQAGVPVPRTCQRCLQPVRVPVTVDTALRFVTSEEEAAALDAEVEYDVLALAPRTNLRTLVEDELLLAMPVVPKHEICPQPLAVADPAMGEADGPAPENPFAVLAALKGGGKP